MVEVDPKTDVKQRLAALRTTLAEATKACPGHISAACGHNCGLCTCGGTGEVAAFEEFRQVCSGGLRPWFKHTDKCVFCKDTPGWQVRAGGMAAGLAGLSRIQAKEVFDALGEWAYWTRPGLPDDPMPSEAEIDVEALELVIEVVEGLEVPSACAS